MTRTISPRVSLGGEVTRHGPDSVGAGAKTALGFGSIWTLKAPFAILASAGPEWEDGRRGTGLHGYIALGLSF